MGKIRKTYERFKARKKWHVLEGIGISVLVAYVFYQSRWGLLCMPIVIPFWNVIRGSAYENDIKRKLKSEFKEFMLLTTNSLSAGYSLEKAFLVAEDEIRTMFGKKSKFLNAVHQMNGKIALNFPMEKAFVELAEDLDLDEAKDLALVLAFSKRAGGDYSRQIRGCAMKLEEKMTVEQEIDTLTAAKLLELRVMCLMPVMIILYIKVSSADFLAPLYGNAAGAIIMTIGLGIYLSMVILGMRITQIDV